MNQQTENDELEAALAALAHPGEMPAQDMIVDVEPSGSDLPVSPTLAALPSSRRPKPEHRLRNLSELGVVRFAEGSEMLLPGDVSGHLEQSGAQSDNALRRRVSRVRLASPSFAAADQYIAEREQKRLKKFDIMEHRRYTMADVGVAAFAGVRRIAGESLVLLKRNEVILVMPIDEKTANRLSRLAIGNPVTCAGIGVVKTKGRSR